MHSLRMEFGVFKMRFIVAALSLMSGLDGSITPHTDFRLPTNFEPISYDLKVITHLEGRFKFEGLVRIKILCKRAADTVVLHTSELDIDVRRVRLFKDNGKRIAVDDVLIVPATELIHVQASHKLKVGKEYLLNIPFAGNITDSLVGYYRSSYYDKATNQKKWLAVTQFEPANARRAFPCFDEPAMKAKFLIRIGHLKQLKSVSNMPLLKISPLRSNMKYVLDEFQETLPMSTYLVAYMVSDFKYIKADDYDEDEDEAVRFRILVRKDAAYQTELAKNTGLTISKYYEDYFDEKFSLPKQDMVALPDFSFGAMENWGLITYRETALLIDPDTGTLDDIHRVVDIIVHEVAHQWFGNLVTMKWWTDLWLSEGFATYLAARGVDFLYPKWNSFQVTTALNFIRVLELDALQSSHPVSVPVKHPNEIAQIFDTISYMKGSYLLHMMNAFLGEETFKQGLRNYIQKYKYSNADQDDLWRILTNEAHRVGSLKKSITIKQIMDTWTLQTGYPVLKVERHYNLNRVTISQARFTANKSISTNENSCWWVPLTMTTSSESNFNITKADKWLNCKIDELTIPLKNEESWVMLNIQLTGLYRVLYDERNLIGIIRSLNEPKTSKKIHPLNRVQIIDDALTLALVGDVDYGFVFQILKYLKHERQYAPWLAVLNGLGPLNKLMRRTPNKSLFEAYMQRLLLPTYNRMRNMTAELKRYEKIHLKNLIIGAACQYQVKDCIDQAVQLFENWMKKADPDHKNILPRELRSTIYCHALKHGGEKEWDFLWNRYLESNIATEKAKLLSALGCTSNTSVLKKYLYLTIGRRKFIRKQDATSVFNAVASNEFGFDVAKDFLYNNITEISKYFYPQSHPLGLYIKSIGSQMTTEKELEEIQLFIKKSSKHLNGTEMTVNQTIETIKINIEWMSEFYEKVSFFMGDGRQ